MLNNNNRFELLARDIAEKASIEDHLENVRQTMKALAVSEVRLTACTVSLDKRINATTRELMSSSEALLIAYLASATMPLAVETPALHEPSIIS